MDLSYTGGGRLGHAGSNLQHSNAIQRGQTSRQIGTQVTFSGTATKGMDGNDLTHEPSQIQWQTVRAHPGKKDAIAGIWRFPLLLFDQITLNRSGYPQGVGPRVRLHQSLPRIP